MSTMLLRVQVGPLGERDRSIWVYRPDHHRQLVGQVKQHSAGTGSRRRGWTVELFPYLEDALTDEQKLHIGQLTRWHDTLDEARTSASVVVGMLLTWWLANQLPRNTFDDLETRSLP